MPFVSINMANMDLKKESKKKGRGEGEEEDIYKHQYFTKPCSGMIFFKETVLEK